MPLQGKAKAAYQREYMREYMRRKRKTSAKTVVKTTTVKTHEDVKTARELTYERDDYSQAEF